MIYLITASLVWAFSFALTKGLTNNLDPLFVAWARIAVAVPVFLPFLRLKNMDSKLMIRLLIVGAIQYGGTYTFYISSFAYLESYEVALFTIFTPIYVTLIDNIIRKEFKFINLVMALVAVVGAAVIKYQDKSLENLLMGFVLMQISNICFSFGQIEYRRIRQIHSNLVDRQVYALLFIGALMLATVAVSFKSGAWESLTAATTEQWMIIAYLGAIATGIGFFFWNIGAVKSGAGTLAVMNNMKIPLAVFVSIAFFGEKADILRLVLGGGLMILAVVITERYKSRQKQ